MIELSPVGKWLYENTWYLALLWAVTVLITLWGILVRMPPRPPRKP